MKNVLTMALEQANPIVGDISGNAKRMLDARKRHSGLDLVVFPECFLSGYPLEDLALRAGFIGRVMDEIRSLCEAIQEEDGPALLFGAPVSGSDLPYNAAVLIRSDGTLSMAHKSELPNNDVFDEVRTFQRGERARPMMLNGFKLGVMICEDMWHGRVAKELAGELAEVLIVINGSPFEEDKQAIRIQHAKRAVADTGLPLIYLNQVGGQDEVVFDGASFAYDGKGHQIANLSFCQEDSVILSLTKEPDGALLEWQGSDERGTISFPHTPYPVTSAMLYGACVLGLSDYIAKIGNPDVVIGVSGGLDSALVAAMAVDALGADKVTGIMMPSVHTGQESLDLAEDLMVRLGIRRMVLPIGDVVESTKVFSQAAIPLSEKHMSVALENIQARIRGLALMTLANAEGTLVLSTGNKSEMSVGYATLYGDMNGGFNPLKDLYKTEVKALSLWRNGASEIPGRDGVFAKDVIPERIIDRPPTAELADGQSDEAALGSYTVLDALLRGLIEGNLDAEAARRRAEKEIGEPISQEYAFKISKLLRGAEFKRRQACPGIKLTSRSFGKGWRYPIAGSGNFENRKKV